MPSWYVIVLGLVGVIGLFVLIGLVKSVIRLIIAALAGLILAGLAYLAVQALGFSDAVPGIAFLLVGAITALLVLIRS
ncbi:MAG: hypothetical protein ACP5JG_03305 [Anaerolineae bacterium]